MPSPSYYMGFAKHAATASKDSTKVGAILVGSDGEIRLTAYNGPPRGVVDSPDIFERPAKYLYASHAETNLIAFAAREGIRTCGCTVYVTHHPCSTCTRTLIQAGIKRIVFDDGQLNAQTVYNTDDLNAARVMLAQADVAVDPFKYAEYYHENNLI